MSLYARKYKACVLFGKQTYARNSSMRPVDTCTSRISLCVEMSPGCSSGGGGGGSGSGGGGGAQQVPLGSGGPLRLGICKTCITESLACISNDTDTRFVSQAEPCGFSII